MKNNNKTTALLNKKSTGISQQTAKPEAPETQHKQKIEASQTQNKQKREASRDNTYKMLIEVANNIEEGIALVQDVKDRHGAIIFTNDAVTKLLGYSRNELRQMSLSDLLSPDTIQELRHRNKRRQAGEETEENYEIWILAKDGTEMPVQVKVSYTNFMGKPAIVGFIRNKSESEQAEEDLRRNIEYFKALIENSFDTIMILNVDGSIGYASPSIERLLGYEAEELIGKRKVFEFIHPDSLEKGISVLYEIIQIPGCISKLELTVQHRDGTWRTTEAIGSNLLDNPSVAGIVVNLRDTTDRKEAEEKFRQLLIDINDGYAVYQDDKIVFASTRLAEMLGYTVDEIVGKDFSTFAVPSDTNDPSKEYERVVKKQGEAKDRYEIVSQKKDGTSVILDISLKVIEYNDKPAFSITARDITDRKEAEEKFRQLLLDINDGYAIYQDDKIVFASTRLAEMLGYTVDEIVGKDFSTFATPSDTNDPSKEYQRVVEKQGEAKDRYEIVTNKKDGTSAILDISLKVIDYDGRPAFSITARDITDRKQAEEALKRSQEYYQALIENTYDTIVVLNRLGNVRYVSPPLKKMLGYEPSEWIDKNIFSFIRPDRLEEVKSIFHGGVQDTDGFLEMSMRHKDGSWRIIEGTGENLLSNPSIQGIVANFHDVTESKQTESRYKSLIEDINDGYIIYQDDAVVIANERFLEIFGYRIDQVLGRSFLDFIAFEALEEISTNTEDSINDTSKYEMPALKGDGTQIIVELSHMPIEYRGRRAYSAIFRDITERRKMEDALRRSNEELQQFAYVASHDLQEPLRMVSSYVQLLARRYQGKLDEDADEFIEFAVDGATRMKRLINDLLAYSRISTQGNEFESVDLENAFERATFSLQTAIEESGVELTHDALPSVMGDTMQLTQLLQNLIGNAIKFRQGESHRVHVSAQRRHDEWLFSVRDNGIGIEPQFHDRIFTIFQRLNNRAEYSGTGIGLTICRRIVERHGGRIWVESEYGKGATFYYTIPVKGGNN